MLIYPSVACFILLKDFTRSPISSLLSTVKSDTLKSYLAIFRLLSARSTRGRTRVLDSTLVSTMITASIMAEKIRITYLIL